MLSVKGIRSQNLCACADDVATRGAAIFTQSVLSRGPVSLCVVSVNMSDAATINTQSIADYLAQLLKDRKQVTAFPNVFIHVERLIDEGKWKLKRVADVFFLFLAPTSPILRFGV